MSEEMEEIEVILGFDTTGSMSGIIAQVRRVAKQTAQRLFSTIPNIRIGVVGLGDYCDDNDPYITSWLDLTTDADKVAKFIETVKNTGGGDADEAYEKLLHEARSQNWQAGKKRILVIIGDAKPHPRGYTYGRHKVDLDWKNEVKMLKEMGVQIYAVQALGGYRGSSVRDFYEHMAEETGGYYLELNQFDSVVDMITAICYKQQSQEALDKWEIEVNVSGRKNRTIEAVFDVLNNRPVKRYETPSSRSSYSSSYSGPSRRTSVFAADKAIPEGRFQSLMIDKTGSIQDVVKDMGLIFQAGRCFYEFTKPETVRPGREVLLFDKETGEALPNSESRKLLGLDKAENIRANPKIVPAGMTCFIQSTSYTRKLIGGTRLLYEVDLSR